jgi:hypothetical protein
MAFGPNRSAARPGSSVQTAGGTIIKLRHPFLSYQINENSPVDEIDVSSSLRLNDTFFDASPSQANSFQEVLVDGSTITVTNHLLNGRINLQVLPKGGFVGKGDFIAAAHLIVASKDDTLATVTVTQFINGVRRTTIFYGVSFENVPHLKIAGNSVVVYPITMLYAGWVQGAAANTDVNAKTIWAVGNKYGLKAVYKPYAIQEAENKNDFYGGKPISGDVTGVGAVNADTPSGDIATLAGIGGADGISPDVPSEQVTWA